MCPRTKRDTAQYKSTNMALVAGTDASHSRSDTAGASAVDRSASVHKAIETDTVAATEAVERADAPHCYLAAAHVWEAPEVPYASHTHEEVLLVSRVHSPYTVLFTAAVVAGSMFLVLVIASTWQSMKKAAVPEHFLARAPL